MKVRTHFTLKRVFMASHALRTPSPTVTPLSSKVTSAVSFVSGGPGKLSLSLPQVSMTYLNSRVLTSSSHPKSVGRGELGSISLPRRRHLLQFDINSGCFPDKAKTSLLISFANRCASAAPLNTILICEPILSSTFALRMRRLAIISALSTSITRGTTPY